MSTDDVLSGLIDQNLLARERYYLCKGQELSPRKDGLTTTARHRRTNTADAVSKKAETALWLYRATHLQ